MARIRAGEEVARCADVAAGNSRRSEGTDAGRRSPRRPSRRPLVMVSDAELLEAVLRPGAAAGCELLTADDPAEARRLVEGRPARRPGCGGGPPVLGERAAAPRTRRRRRLRSNRPPWSGSRRSRSAPNTSMSLPEAESWLVAALAKRRRVAGETAPCSPSGWPRRCRGVGARRGGRGDRRAGGGTGRCSWTAIRWAAGSISCSVPKTWAVCAGPGWASATDAFRRPPCMPRCPHRTSAAARAGWPCCRATGRRTGRRRRPSAPCSRQAAGRGRRWCATCRATRRTPRSRPCAPPTSRSWSSRRTCAPARRRPGWRRSWASTAARVGLVVRGPAPGGIAPDEVATALDLPLVAAMRPEPGLARALERGTAPGRPRGPLAAAATAVLAELKAAATGHRP